MLERSLDSLQDENLWLNETFAFELFRTDEDACSIFDPNVEISDLKNCNSYRGAVCQFKKGNMSVYVNLHSN